MKNKIEALKVYYKLHPKRFWIGGGVVLLVIFGMFFSSSGTPPTLITVTKTDLKETVLGTGQVTSNVDLNLSFPTGGLIKYLPVSVGDKVYKGQTLASFDNRNEYAALISAKANYQKVLEGASNEDVAVSQAALDIANTNLENTKHTQAVAVSNAHRALMNADLTPLLASGYSSYGAPVVTGTYDGEQEGVYHISFYNTSSSGYFSYNGLESGVAQLSQSSSVPLGTHGLFIQFPSNASITSQWDLTLPNKQSVKYLAAYNAYQSALQDSDSAISGAQAAVTKAQADLDLKKSAARPADLAVAEAGVLTAQVAYDNTILTAPASGTIVHVDTKVGERADAQKEIMVLQDVSNLYVEANINETSLAQVKEGQPVDMTFDAFGPDTKFNGWVMHIDPSSTTSDGVVNYVIKVSVEKKPDTTDIIRPGMNANMVITCADYGDEVVIPQAAITKNTDGTQIVNLVTDKKTGKYKTQIVTTGDEGDGNLIEIKSGLAEGDSIALVAQK